MAVWSIAIYLEFLWRHGWMSIGKTWNSLPCRLQHALAIRPSIIMIKTGLNTSSSKIVWLRLVQFVLWNMTTPSFHRVMFHGTQRDQWVLFHGTKRSKWVLFHRTVDHFLIYEIKLLIYIWQLFQVPPWLQTDYQNEVNKNLQPSYTALTRSVTGGEERERRDSIMSRASSKLRIEHLSFRRHADHRSAPTTPVCVELPPVASKPPTPDAPLPPDSPLDWSERGAGDGLSNQQDSDFGNFFRS